jgi:hypothetical protein
MNDISHNYTELIYDNELITSNIENVLLIDSVVENNTSFWTASNENTFPIIYSYSSDKKELFDLLVSKFTNIKRIGFVFNASPNNYMFLNSEPLFYIPDLSNNNIYSSNTYFMLNIINRFSVLNIDFLACDTLNHNKWLAFYNILYTETSVIVGASNSNTGNILYSNDWITESTKENIENIYLTSDISNYQDTLHNTLMFDSYNFSNYTSTTPYTNELEYNINIDFSKIKNVLLVDKSVLNYNDFMIYTNEMTFPIAYSHSSNSNDLLSLLNDKFTKIDRIAFACHGSSKPNMFLDDNPLFTETDLSSSVYSSNCNNIINIINTYSVVNIDFLGCNTLQYDNWKAYYKLLQDNTNVIVGASNDTTGNILYGGDWVMESTNEDIQNIYFTSDIGNYSSTLTVYTGRYLSNNIYYTYYIDGGFNYCYLDDADKTMTQPGLFATVPIYLYIVPFGFTFVYCNLLGINSNAFYQSVLNAISFPNSSYFNSIDTYAFYGCHNLTSITLPSYLNNIGTGAFQQSGLRSIVIPSSVTNIGNATFLGCPLSSVTLPTNSYYTTINESVFNGCSSLGQITIPQYVVTIGVDAFANSTSLSSVTFNSNITTISQGAFASTRLTTMNIPSTVSSIGNSAFMNCSNLSSVTLPTNSSYTSIAGQTFNGCSNLSTINMPQYITSIEYNAFVSCTSLRTIDISYVTSIGGNAFLNSGLTAVTFSSGITTITDSVFQGCSGLTSVTFPSNVTSIGSNAFLNCSNLSSVTIRLNTSTIASTSFSGCSALTSVTFIGTAPASGTDLYNYVLNLGSVSTINYYRRYSGWPLSGLTNKNFVNLDTKTTDKITYTVTSSSECSATCSDTTISSIDMSQSITMTDVQDGNYTFTVTNILSNAFEYSSLSLITLPTNSSFTTINNYTFNSCSLLRTITIPQYVTRIGTYAFASSGLYSISIPSNVTTIDTNAFQGCSGLTSITLPTNTNFTTINNYTFNECSLLRSINIPQYVTRIGTYAFASSGLTSISIPSSVSTIDTNAFLMCSSLSSINLPTNSNFTSINNDTFNECSSLRSITIPSYVTRIGTYAFVSSGLTSISIPSSVSTIDTNAFQGCSGLTSITLPTNINFTTINDWVFQNCISLASITIPSNVASIGINTFYNCTSLSSVTIRSNTLTITNTSFNGCRALASVTFIGTASASNQVLNLSSVSTIKYYSRYSGWPLSGLTNKNFVNLDTKTTDKITYTVTSSSECSATCSDTTISSIDMSQSITMTDVQDGNYTFTVTNILSNAFQNCSSLSSITLPTSSSFTTINNYTFNSCSLLRSITIPQYVTRIGTYAFASSGLTSISIPSSVSTIDTNAFQNCSGLTLVTLPTNLSFTTINNYTFNSCSLIRTISIPSTVTRLGTYAFASSGLTSISIPSSVSTIDTNAFQGCTSLTSITLPTNSGFTSINNDTFNSCSSLRTVSIPSTVTSLGTNAFANSGLTSLTIPSNITSIGSGAFNYCYSLRTMAIPSTVISLGTNAFANSGLTSLTIPSSVTITNTTFFNCSQLNTVFVMGNAPSGASTIYLYLLQNTTTIYYYGETNTGWTSQFRQGLIGKTLINLDTPVALSNINTVFNYNYNIPITVKTLSVNNNIETIKTIVATSTNTSIDLSMNLISPDGSTISSSLTDLSKNTLFVMSQPIVDPTISSTYTFVIQAYDLSNNNASVTSVNIPISLYLPDTSNNTIFLNSLDTNGNVKASTILTQTSPYNYSGTVLHLCELVVNTSIKDISNMILYSTTNSIDISYNIAHDLITLTKDGLPENSKLYIYYASDSSNNYSSYTIVDISAGTSSTQKTTISDLSSNTDYYISVDISNTVFPLYSKLTYIGSIKTDAIATSGGDPHITTVSGETYDLPHDDGLYLLFNNMNNFKVTCECMHLTEEEINNSTFSNELLYDTTFMTRIYIYYNDEIISVDLNTLKYNVEKKGTKQNIIFNNIYEDKYVLKKYYNNNKSLYNKIKYNGKSRDITIRDYNIKVSVDLNCADHRNDVVISGKNMTGYGAIISSSHKSLLMKY